ncbi:hypothetical protein CANCADRAFT_30099 [Tortispora caseinolytica NRRL Y-17796]|uniref:Thioredoxin domain-containing protein n=1 Tax=Tortispora caseinolytica NRRL Y-17796 TaxID=767744 RepID=A0A1E4TJ47_9ASCO|nr:hypothetical protein CANCADRAFT_30099 [Tortispora caseinolytica NRRL Y-17796]
MKLSWLLPVAVAAASLEEILSRSKGGQPIEIFSDDEVKTILAEPREDTVIFVFTALDPSINCEPCRMFKPTFELLAKSWYTKHSGGLGLQFAFTDFKNNRETFQRLQILQAPLIKIYPGKRAAFSEEIQYTPTSAHMPAEYVAKEISQLIGIELKINRPTDWATVFLKLSIGLLVLTSVYFTARHIRTIIFNKFIWTIISIFLYLTFVSGSMFNNIRHVPYVGGDGHGNPAYFANGLSMQFAVESQIVTLLYGALAFAVIALATRAATNKNPSVQAVTVFSWLFVLYTVNAYLVSVFSSKQGGGYPFHLPPW